MRLRCVRCCIGTEMLLTEEDVERVTAAGFAASYFSLTGDGWLELKNVGGRCVFNDGAKCMIYDDRPEGCRTYPLVYHKGGARLDADCPHGTEFEFGPEDTRKVVALAKKLRCERAKRMGRR